MHYSLHLIFSLSLSKEKKNRKKTTLKNVTFSLLFLSCHAQLSHTKKCPYFHLFPYSFSLVLLPSSLATRERGKSHHRGPTDKGGSATWLPAAWHFPHFIFRFIITEKSHRVSFYQSRYESLFSSHFGVLCFISFTFIRWGKLLVSHFTIEPKWCLERKTKNKKKQFFEIIHEVRNIKFLLSSPVLLSFFFSFRYLSFLPYFPPDRIQDFLFFLIKGERTGNFPFFLNKVNLNYSFCGGKWPSVPDSIPLVYSKMDVLLSTIISYTLKYNIIKKTQQQLINIILTLVSILELCIHKESKSEHI